MPIYEYLCPTCNRVFSFMAKSHVESLAKQPSCPKCGRPELAKVMSKFAVLGAERKSAAAAGDDGGGGEMTDGLDDPRIEREMERLMQDAEGMNEEDPRQLGQLMRRMSEITGEPLEGEMAEAIRRLESGEDPESIEEDLGDLLDDGGPGAGGAPPTQDDGLYAL